MKSLLAFAALTLGCFAFATGATAPKSESKPAPTYCGSSKSNVYHLPKCGSAKRIAAGNLVTFATKVEASKKGYRPCLVCKP